MKTPKSVLIMFITLLIGVSLFAGGCGSYAKKPAPNPAPSTPMTPTDISPAPMTPNATSPAPTSTMEVANKASMEAGKVMGVNMATAIVSDKTIYIGLTLNANGDKTKSAAVEKNVMDKVKSMEPGYTVMVTSDMNTVASIKTVAEGVAQGKPMSSFTKEMDMIMMKINPKGK